MNIPILACDLRTRATLRVYACADGGTIATDHPLNLVPLAARFVRGNVRDGFTAVFEGASCTFARYGDAVECARCAIGNVFAEGARAA
jgi:hypothetical protein